MKKTYRFAAFALCALLCFSLVLTACSKSEPKVSVSEDSAILVEAFANLTEGNYADAISAFSRYQDKASSPNLAIEIGMGKAYFGMGDYQNAESAFLNACNLEADRADLIHYLGEAQMQSGNYSAAVETFERLLEQEPENITAMSKLEQSLRQNKDYMGLYKFFEKRMDAIKDDKQSEQSYYSGKLLEAAQLTKDDNLILATIDRFKNTPQGLALDTGYRAYTLLSAGNMDDAKKLLFDVENIDALVESAGRTGCYFGEFNDAGAYQGSGLIIFGSDRNSICQVYIGEFAEGKPNGTGVGYRGYISEFEDNDGKPMLQKTNSCIESNWKDGIPDGYVVKTTEYTTYREGVLQYISKTIETATYTDGLAQGEVWTEFHYNNPSNSYGASASFSKYVVVDGDPVPFEVTIYGKTITTYEAYYGDSKTNAPQYAQEEKPQYLPQFKFR